jgi:cellulose synthase/poly-beta-1,6-N-acetylglucosamine synthase-like glycosyltransferase
MGVIIFWSSIGLIVYTFVGFPLLLLIMAWLRPRPHKVNTIEPSVSIVIAAYNEEQDIASKIQNLLALRYPREKLEIIIASDGSSDKTHEIVRQFEGDGIKLLALPRQGKAGTLNDAVATAKGEILVFSDANSLFAVDAIEMLVRNFSNPEVGAVAGDQRYQDSHTNLSGSGEKSYWNLDRLLKTLQTKVGHVTSATGAIYAIRHSLFCLVPEAVTDDFVTSTQVIAQGYRLVFEREAAAYEPVASTSGVEYGRKVRVMTRGLNSIKVMRGLLNPFKYGFYALQLFSHKVLRRLLFIPFVVLLIVTPFLWGAGLIYQLALVAQLFFYLMAIVGAVLEFSRLKKPKVLALPFFMVMVYLAAAVATWNMLRGRAINRWDPQRNVDDSIVANN